MKYLDAGVNIARVNLLSGKENSLAERIETILNQLDDDAACKRIGWTVSINHIHIIQCMYAQMHTIIIKCMG